MLFVVCWVLVRCSLSVVVRCSLFVACCSLYVGCWLRFAVCCLLVVCCVLLVLCYFVIVTSGSLCAVVCYASFFVGCCLLSFNVCC